MGKGGWIVTGYGFYLRRSVHDLPAFGPTPSWDGTDDRAQAHVFRTKAEAMAHAKTLREGWQAERVKADQREG